ncbi:MULTISPECIES: MmcB family DNA repair protein [Bacillus]|nr:MmcB family DNA repair protein [Bacillus cereus]
MFVGVKAPDNDCHNDKKWKDYLTYCDKFYFFRDGSYMPSLYGTPYI